MLRRFLQNRSGNFAVSTAILSIPIFAMVGLSVDYGRAVLQRQAMQNAADAAVLAAASSGEITIDGLTDIATRFYRTNMAEAGYPSATTLQLTKDANDDLTVSVSDMTPLTLGAMFYPKGLNVGVSAKASRQSGNKLEIALVLDTTYSMSSFGNFGTRMMDLRYAVQNMMYEFRQADPDGVNIRVAMVPFAQYVNIGTNWQGQDWLQYMYWNRMNWVAVPTPMGTSFTVTRNSCRHTSSTCTFEFGSNDGIPETVKTCTPTGALTCSQATTNYTWRGCVGSRPSPYDLTTQGVSDQPYPALANVGCGDPVIPLTNNLRSISAAAWSLTPSGETYVGAGILWGWNVLTPDPPFTEAAPMDGKVNKVMVVMTDGANTRAPDYPAHNSKDQSQSTRNMLALCDSVKRDGITLYTVAFRINDPQAIQALRTCASSDQAAFLSDRSLSLVAILTKIARNVAGARLTM